ncbi:AAA family ATPase [Candidatus Thiosymbion oneisti]|uniref:AAA family ATPase n=1 Tax=Candidatus Thiosymbion oneisti TaxID=589554 RepID=UPI000AAAA4FD|nr:AAA family ATPase [Candidatus Thiosymbion oneisti]
MRIDQLALKHFKGFEDRELSFHPEFNLLVGRNGTGKTGALDALAVAVSSWFWGIGGDNPRHIRPNEVRGNFQHHEEIDDQGQRHVSVNWEYLYPCEVTARGEVQGESISWLEALKGPESHVTHEGATPILELASAAGTAVREGKEVFLPLISYYGTERLCQGPESFRVTDLTRLFDKEGQSRLAGYGNSIDPRLSVDQLIHWIVRQSWIAYQRKGRASPVFEAVKKAIVGCLEGASNLDFDAVIGEVVIEMEDETQPFSNLSDGQRSTAALVGDMAQRAARLNPHYGGAVLQQTSGVVLIDELDLHLHPRWQRRIIEDLRRTFPKIQFICTTHSPFLIQSLRSGEELLMLDGQPTANVANLPVEEIAQGIMGIPNPQVSMRYEEMTGAARHYFEELEAAAKAPEEKLAEYKVRLAETIAPYADNPAFQAFLEMKRAAKLGE